MAFSLAPMIKQRYLDSNGNPLAGGKLYSYQANTSTPQATYTDSTGVTPNANPVILDANGEANVWLDVSLSYKFILKDSTDATQWTVDNVVGLITNNAVSTAALQDGSVTTAKLADDAVTSAKLADDASIDANRAVTTNHIRDSAVTAAKLASLAVTRDKLSASVLLAPSLQKYTSGSGTYGLSYYFVITSGNATEGATYTNNTQTFTVARTVASSLIVLMKSTGAPTASGTLTKSGGTGDATLTFSTYVEPIYSKVRMVGGGGGGASNGFGTPGSGGAGGDTTFGSILTAGGGLGGVAGVSGSAGGAGGTVTINTPAISFVGLSGARGAGGANSAQTPGGSGGSSPFGGAGSGPLGGSATAGYAAVANSGSGGSGASVAAGAAPGGGGGSGGYIEAMIYSPSATYAYAVGAAGAAGTAGGGGNAGGAGGSGVIIVEDHFQ